MFNNKTILITGGTGSFGQRFIRAIIKNLSQKINCLFARRIQTIFNAKRLSIKKISIYEIFFR